MKPMRLFLGAALAALAAVLMAATFDEPLLLIPAGIIGWLIGYHGDRFVIAVMRGMRYVRRVGPAHCIAMLEKRSMAVRVTFSIGRGIKSGAEVFSRRAKKVPGLLGTGAMYSVKGLRAGFLSLGNLAHVPGKCVAWIRAHESHRAMVIRLFSVLTMFGVFVGAFWWLSAFMATPVGEEILATGGGTTIQTPDHFFVERAVMAILLPLFPGMAALVAYFTEESTRVGRRDLKKRYASLHPAGFFLVEALRFGQCFLWIITFCVVFCVSVLIMLIGAVAIVEPLARITFPFIHYGPRLMWRFVRINRDYGLVSLGVGLVISAITFFLFREELVTSLVYRTAISAAAGFAAGTITVVITSTCAFIFKGSRELQRRALRPGYTRKGAGIERNLEEKFEQILGLPYRLMKILLPINVRRGVRMEFRQGGVTQAQTASA